MKKFVNFRLPLFIMLSLTVGIAVSYFIFMQNILPACIFAVIFLTCTALYCCLSKEKGELVKRLIFCLVFIVVFIFGFISIRVQIGNYEKANLNNHYEDIVGTVTEKGQDDSCESLVVSDLQLSKGRSTDYKLLLYVYGTTDIDIGDKISFNCLLNDYDKIYEGRLASSNIQRKIKYYSSISSDEISVIGNKTDLFQKVNLFIRDSLSDGLTKEEFSVAYALLTGNSEYMEDGLINTFRLAGVAHIFAVSGLHIGFLALLVNFILKKLRANKILRIIILAVILFFYTGVCGFSASSIRAFIMCITMMICSFKGAKYDGLSALSIAGFIILVIDPIELFCAGFELSFAVVFGLLTLSNPISKIFKFLPYKMANAVGAVISAQIMSIPISLYFFNRFSTLSLIINLLFIPVVGAIYIALFLLTFLGGIFGISNILLFPLNYVLKAVIFLISVFDYEIFLIGGITFSVFAIAYYLVFILLGGIVNLKRLAKAIAVSVLSVICVLGTTLKSIDKKDVIYVSGSDSICASLISYGRENILVVSDLSKVYSINRLQRIYSRCNVEKLSKVIVLNMREDADLQLFTTKLITVFEVEKIIYHGERDFDTELIMAKSFPDIRLDCFSDGEEINSQKVNMNFALDGHCLEVSVKDKNLAILSSGEKGEVNILGLTKKYDLIITPEYADNVDGIYSPKQLISYRRSFTYSDAESQGNIIYYL